MKDEIVWMATAYTGNERVAFGQARHEAIDVNVARELMIVQKLVEEVYTFVDSEKTYVTKLVITRELQ
jgi:hypothetical protein